MFHPDSARKTRRSVRSDAIPMAFVLGLVFWVVAARAAETDEPSALQQEFDGRGVYYVEGRVRSPVGTTTARSPFATNRVVIDDEYTKVQVDRAKHRIIFRNTHSYGLDDLVSCVVLMGRGTTAKGRIVTSSVHLKIHKTLNKFRSSIHPHPTVRDELVTAEFEPFEIVLDNGEKQITALTEAQAIEAVRDPALSARLANLVMQVSDNLEGHVLAPQTKGAPLVDLSFGFGSQNHNLEIARVRLLSNDPANAELLRTGSVDAMLRHGDWEFRVDSNSPYIPRSNFDRDFFLFGLEGLSAIQEIAKRGLLRGETLVVGFHDGAGFISVGDRRSEIPNPADVARAYMEFHFVGGIVAEQVAGIPARLK